MPRNTKARPVSIEGQRSDIVRWKKKAKTHTYTYSIKNVNSISATMWAPVILHSKTN